MTDSIKGCKQPLLGQDCLKLLFELEYILQKTQRLRDQNTNISIADLTGIAAQDYTVEKLLLVNSTRQTSHFKMIRYLPKKILSQTFHVRTYMR